MNPDSRFQILDFILPEKENWILWLPVFFGFGIVTYFQLSFEPNLAISVSAFLSAATAIYFYRKNKILLWILLLIASFVFGFSAASIRTKIVAAPIIKTENKVAKITGRIQTMEELPQGIRLVLDRLTIENLAPEDTPEKIRLTVKTKYNNATAGDTISVLGALSPPPPPAIPDGYNFARSAFFQQIGAVGYSVSDVEIVNKSTSGENFVEKIRRNIVEKILAKTNKEDGSIAVALLVGEQNGIPKQIREDWRIAGITHILSISGLHMTLAVGIFFFSIRAIFAAIPPIANRYNIKKWAAIAALISSYAYLEISGSPIAAQRAFIMTSLILIAIIIDRSGTPMRSIAFAAFAILLLMPEAMLDVGFQMSFASVIALISSYTLVNNATKKLREIGIITKCILYFFGIVFSSLIAGAATAPFTIYQFNNFSSYGTITNLLAIPITSFIVMPAGMAALLLMPFGLEGIGLAPMAWAINLTSQIAHYIASLPQATGSIAQLSDSSFALIVIGGLWLCLWQTKLRLIGLAPVFIGIILALTPAPSPDILIDGDGKLFAVKVDNQLLYSSAKTEKYSRETWQKKAGDDDFKTISSLDSDSARCDSLGCIYKQNNYTAIFPKHPLALAEDCAIADVIINLTHDYTKCDHAKLTINLSDLKTNGTYAVYLSDSIIAKSVMGEIGDRPWGAANKRDDKTAQLSVIPEVRRP